MMSNYTNNNDHDMLTLLTIMSFITRQQDFNKQ